MLLKAIKFWRFDPVTVFNKLGLTGDSSKETGILHRRYVARRFNESGLAELFQQYGDELDKNEGYRLFLSGHKRADIVNVFDAALAARSVVEFGSGVSTIAMAFAMKKKGEGKVCAVEADTKWADLVRSAADKLGVSEFCTVMHSVPRLHRDGTQVFSLFDSLPNIRPDLIYLDGPSPSSVEEMQQGLTMRNLEFIVVADPLLYEWSFYVGAKIIVDGRINNVRFLQKNLKRQYTFRRNFLRNTSTFTLVR